ncbi:hypothetical protein E1A91_A09G091700v1 [Gossypium mustelinum]|uniref:Uncharacterized protein n=1 Tax=Gossypium mustelinum TaxID=34275 RepID=A0A5D2XV78_GOSMU|nr:hypothetical protein E1A91_A09G091700v1 [Gossypium mustelinum]
MALKSSSLVIWISPGIEELVKKLKARNTDVYLISEGFRQMINVCNYATKCLKDHICFTLFC